jgi:hypothetical protein
MKGVAQRISVITTQALVFFSTLEGEQFTLHRDVLLRNHSADRTLTLDVPFIRRNSLVHRLSTP